MLEPNILKPATKHSKLTMLVTSFVKYNVICIRRHPLTQLN